MKHIEQAEPRRDRWSRPIVDGVTCSRGSSLGVGDKSGLINWARKDALQHAQETPSILDLPLGEAVAATRDKGASGLGTLIHEYVSASLLGDDLPDSDDIRVEKCGVAILRELEGWHPAASELFVASPDMQVGGTLDLLVERHGITMVADIKTGAKDAAYAARYGATDWAVQMGLYARCLPMDAHGDLVEWESLGLSKPAPDRGVAFIVDTRDATVVPWWVVLDEDLIRLALTLRSARKAKFDEGQV